MRKSAPTGEDCRGGNESEAFLERACYSSSPDAVFIGSTKCLSITPVVIERDGCKREGPSWGKQQCGAVRGKETPGFFSLDLSSLASACVVEGVQLCLPAVAQQVRERKASMPVVV